MKTYITGNVLNMALVLLWLFLFLRTLCWVKGAVALLVRLQTCSCTCEGEVNCRNNKICYNNNRVTLKKSWNPVLQDAKCNIHCIHHNVIIVWNCTFKTLSFMQKLMLSRADQRKCWHTKEGFCQTPWCWVIFEWNSTRNNNCKNTLGKWKEQLEASHYFKYFENV